jgi:succinate dehydrogenase/fumarate reductase flavoprotein subunit
VNVERAFQGSELEVDLVVLGGGMAGMSAAGYAASRGATVCVIEKGGEIGGSAVLSSGALSAAASYEKLRERAPRGNPRLQAAFVDRFAPAAEWVRSLGVIGGEISSEFLKGYRLDILAYIQCCEALVVSQGGWVLRSTTVDRLILDDGAVRGVSARDASGPTVVIRGRGVVLATGGFQGDPSLLHEQFGANAHQLLLRANPYSTGDGLRLGLQAGADLAGDLSSFYGHLIAWPLIEFGPREYQRMSLSRWIPQGILINLSGERFADESIGWQWCATMTVKQPRARAAIVVDAAGHARGREATEQRRGGGDFGTLDDIRRAGARVESRDTMEDLAPVLAGWGYEASRLPATVEKYNDVIDGGTPDSPPRRWERHRFGPGPYTAFDTRPAITGTQGGLRTDESARVIDRGGRPIPGLFVAGTDAGDFYNGGYAGNLSVACVFGMTAVETLFGAKLFPRAPALVG